MSALPVTSPVTAPTSDVPVIVVPVIAAAEPAPITVPSMLPALISTVASVAVPEAFKEVNVPAAALAPPMTAPSTVPPLMSAVSATRASMLAVPSTYRLRHSEPTAHKSYVSSAEGSNGEATSAVTVTVSLAASPRIVLPLTVKFPIIPAFASTSSVSMCAVPSIYKSLNSRELVPRSISLLVTGTMAPSWIRICSTAALDTSTNTPTRLLAVSITTLLRASASAISGT